MHTFFSEGSHPASIIIIVSWAQQSWVVAWATSLDTHVFLGGVA